MKQTDGDDDMRKEYDFTKAEVGKYADRFRKGTDRVVPDPGGKREGRVSALLLRSGHIVGGVLLPATCLVLGALSSRGFHPAWQSGKLGDLAGMLLGADVAFAFYSMMLFSMASMVLLLWSFDRFSHPFVVRLGIYTGAALALQYLAIMLVYLWGQMDDPFGHVLLMSVTPGVMVVPLGIGLLLRWLHRAGLLWWCRRLLWGLLGVPVAFFITWAVWECEFHIALWLFFGVPVATVLIISFVAAPYWAFLSYLFMTIKVAREAKKTGSSRGAKAAGVGSWAAAYAASWWLTVYRAAQVYSSLPKNPPDDCYVCTAAARGHPRVVKSVPVRTKDGGVMMVNDQLRTLKCAEIALREIAPRVHRAVRGVYDVVGPPAARMIVHPLLADLAYLSLKPAERLARLALSLLVPDTDSLSDRVYGRE